MRKQRAQLLLRGSLRQAAHKHIAVAGAAAPAAAATASAATGGAAACITGDRSYRQEM